MKQYSHDYTKVKETQKVLFFALEDFRNDHTYEAKRGIMEARQMLDEYLAQDNMVPDDDVENGWVRYNEAMEHSFTNEQLDFIRDLFAEQLLRAPKSTLAAEELAIINRCQALLNCPEYKCIEQFTDNASGRWTEIETKSQRASSSNVVRHGQIDRQYKQQLDGVGNPDCPLHGKIVRITGTFDQLGMTRNQVAATCQQLGASEVSEGICKKMDIVIVGNNPGPTKLEKITKWRSEGHDIRIISQLELKEIIKKFINN